MIQQQFSETEVMYRQQQLRTGYIESQRQVSISGMRQILGNTILELGSRVHGMAQVACPAAAETRSLVRETSRTAAKASSRLHATVIH